MVAVSKHMFQAAFKDLGCGQVVHPWSKNSCSQGSYILLKDTVVGSAKFYAIVYLIQILMRGRKMKKSKEWLKMGEYYVRSWAMGVVVCYSACPLGCILWNSLGNEFSYYSIMLLPNIINGLAIYLEPPNRRGLVINLFCNLVIEYWIKKAEQARILNVTTVKKVLMFMCGSSALFYLMRLEKEKDRCTPFLWVFSPEQVRKKEDMSQKVCPHEGPCSSYIFEGFAKLFGVGAAISLSRILLSNITRPLTAISSLRFSHFKMAMFFGSYIGIYRVVMCILCNQNGFDSPLYALIAGYLSGMSLVFSPSLGFSIAACTGSIKLISTILYEKDMLPKKVPIPEILYAVSQGLLFHARFMDEEQCPKYIHNLIATVSNKRSVELVANVANRIKDAAIV